MTQERTARSSQSTSSPGSDKQTRPSKVDVYRNLRRNCLSVKSRETEDYGRVVDYVDSIWLADVEFVIHEQAYEKVIETGRKNVHAFVRGKWIDETPNVARQVVMARYNPFERDHFYDAVSGEEILGGDFAYVTTRGVTVIGPETPDTED